MVLVQKELKNAYIGECKLITTPGIYHNATLGLISLSSDGNTRYTMADKNLGATQVWNDGDTLSEANCGKYYQWGNNYGFPFTGATTTSSTNVNASSYGPGNYYSSSTFITGTGNWDTSGNTNLWGGTTGTNEAMQGPSPNGFHIFSHSEHVSLVNVMSSLGLSIVGESFRDYLKMPFAGLVNNSNGAVAAQGSAGRYWEAMQQSGRNSYWFAFGAGYNYENNDAYKKTGASIRCIKNEAVQPDTSWTKLY